MKNDEALNIFDEAFMWRKLAQDMRFAISNMECLCPDDGSDLQCSRCDALYIYEQVVDDDASYSEHVIRCTDGIRTYTDEDNVRLLEKIFGPDWRDRSK